MFCFFCCLQTVLPEAANTSTSVNAFYSANRETASVSKSRRSDPADGIRIPTRTRNINIEVVQAALEAQHLDRTKSTSQQISPNKCCQRLVYKERIKAF